MDEDDVVRPMPPRRTPRPPSRARTWRNRILVVAVPVVLVIASLLRFWVDLLWFGELDQRDVLVTRLQWSTALGVAFGLFVFAVLFVNFVIARRVARDDLYVPFLAVTVDPEAPDQPVVPHFVLKPVLLGIAVVGAVISGLVMSGRWETVLRFMGRSDFGVTDPKFGKDASFYVFTMPLLELIARSLQVLTIVTAIAVIVAYVATGVIRYVPVPRIARPAIVHLSWLVAAFLVVSAFQFRLSMWNLATSTSGVVAGAGWTDVHARIPGYWLMLFASLVLAVAVVWFARKERWRVVGGAVVGWIALSIIVTGLIPSAVQKVLVEPNELDRERAVLEGNMRNTREAFDLEKIDSRPFRDEAKLTEQQLLEDNRGTTDNIRLWSPAVLGSVVNQLQSLRRYYEFIDVDVDRYTVDDTYRQVMVSVRELKSDANDVAQSWTNQHLRYTHGYGAVATWPNEVAPQGRPEFLLKDLPPKPVGQDDIVLDRPEVYFGEALDNKVFVGTKQDEVSPKVSTGDTGAAERAEGAEGDKAAPSDEAGKDETTSYKGKGGISVGGFWRRVAFATTFGDSRILFTDQFTDRSRVLFRRKLEDRIGELAPFLELDHDPYSVVIDGRLKWIVDAYTTSDRFPYSQSVELGGAENTDANGQRQRINYARNSVKAVVDAYDGDVTLYVMDTKDPILGAWRDIFPDLFTSSKKMPDELRAHLRYPEDLFELQTGFWTRYHMKDVDDFYSREDQWEVPVLGKQPMEAFYVLAKLPGSDKEELLLVRPLTPLTKKNMVAYMVARSDGEHYGKLTTFELPQQELTQGPAQVQALIKQDSEIAEQVRFWESGENQVIFGNLLVLPVEKSLLYVQPVYLQNAEAEIPEFQRIVVVLGDTVAWGDTFEEAVRDLLSKQGTDADTAADEDADSAADGDGAPKPGAGDDAPTNDDLGGLSKAQLEQVLGQVSAAYDTALECQRKGDTVCYAEQLERIEDLLATPATAGSPETAAN